MAACLLAASVTLSLATFGCKKSDQAGGSTKKTVISVQGSDTMVNESQAWAEAYGKVDSTVSIEVGGGGSGVGIAALINGTIDIANASRDMKVDEKAKAKANSGKDPVEFTVGFDALPRNWLTAVWMSGRPKAT